MARIKNTPEALLNRFHPFGVYGEAGVHTATLAHEVEAEFHRILATSGSYANVDLEAYGQALTDSDPRVKTALISTRGFDIFTTDGERIEARFSQNPDGQTTYPLTLRGREVGYRINGTIYYY